MKVNKMDGLRIDSVINPKIYKSPIKEPSRLSRIFSRSGNPHKEETRIESRRKWTCREEETRGGYDYRSMDVKLHETHLIALLRKDGQWDILKNDYEERRAWDSIDSETARYGKARTYIDRVQTDLSKEAALEILENWNKDVPAIMPKNQEKSRKLLLDLRKTQRSGDIWGPIFGMGPMFLFLLSVFPGAISTELNMKGYEPAINDLNGAIHAVIKATKKDDLQAFEQALLQMQEKAEKAKKWGQRAEAVEKYNRWGSKKITGRSTTEKSVYEAAYRSICPKNSPSSFTGFECALSNSFNQAKEVGSVNVMNYLQKHYPSVTSNAVSAGQTLPLNVRQLS
jgi:hypothetical protein